MKNFLKIARGVDVLPLLLEVQRQPHLWDRNPCRLSKRGPHHETQDIILRYKDETPNYQDGNLWLKFSDEHIPVWYRAIDFLPSARKLIFDLMGNVGGEMLGCVMLYKLEPGKQVYRHNDKGWHAEYYDKFNICLQSNEHCAFEFDGERMPQRQGDIDHFRNDVDHWVVNNGDNDHIILTACIRLDRGYRTEFSPEGWSIDQQMKEHFYKEKTSCQQPG